MEKHTCKLCFRRFSNGRALGGHMRSHITAAAPTGAPKIQVQHPPSPSFSASASEEVAEVTDRAGPVLMVEGVLVAGSDDGKQFVYYGLRENPRKSFRLVDPEFSSTFPAVDYVAPGGSSIVLQDRESETESSKPPSLRRRSKRRRRSSHPPSATQPEPSFDPEPVSSVSNSTPEEDVARCLMMLSRDVWTSGFSPEKKPKCSNRGGAPREEAAAENRQSDDDSEEEHTTMAKARRGGRSRYQCGTCKKVFRSYQALGGHRASHKNIKACVAPAAVRGQDEEDEKDVHPHTENQIQEADSEVNFPPSTGSTDRRIHECPVCFRVFGSGQALGGHKRSHLAQSSSSMNPSPVKVAPTVAATKKATATAASAVSPVHGYGGRMLVGESLIDLNLPPPADEEGELSAVFDAEQ
ncbi:unnamed protein product [Spirodela intermedia]|uniref:C2H2-type domain-containing protein n=1 Tax=Spirodela intermedia TaxID=51605 RepID=A0A7I8L2Z4_SPIIN|nr:unnamed protein product [Spirodela intermedia]